MKSIPLSGLLLAGFILSGIAQPVQTSQPAATTGQPAVKDPAFDPVIDDPNLPAVLLIGDSISIGYTVPVQKLLQGKANVHRIPENGGPTTNGLAKLDRWLGKRKWDVIHFNFGLHDLRLVKGGKRQVLPEAYEDNLRKIVLQLKATHAKLIWATTTPVPPTIAAKGRRTEDVPIYNDIAAKVMEENQITVDDLYGFALPQVAKIQRPNNVHYTNAGYEALGKAVAASIESALAVKN
jgi:lysophospholipase L1-like esterase